MTKTRTKVMISRILFCLVFAAHLLAPPSFPQARTDRTDTHWSGAVGEMLVYGGPLTDAERLGVEEYLRRKWRSSFDLERPAGLAGSR